MLRTTTLILVSLITMASAQASHLEEVCKGAYVSDAYSNPPLFATNIISRRDRGHSILENFEGTQIFSDSSQIRDVKVSNSGDKILVLHSNEILELSLAGETLGTYTFETKNSDSAGAMTFAQAGNTLFIAQGMGGMTAFDLNTHTAKWHSNLTEVDGGMAVAVATDGQYAYAVMATSREGGFTGVVRMNIENGQVLNKAAYNREWGVIDIEPRASWFNNSLVLNNGGWIHVLTKKQLESKKPVKPRWVAHVIQANGPVTQHYMMTTGGFFFEGNNLVGCGVYTDTDNGQFVRRSSLFTTAMPQ